jgi:hypothetical protein
MAYNLHYIAGYTNKNGNTGHIAIYEDNYSGGTENLKVRWDSIIIRYNWKGWDDPIIGITASFKIANDKDDFFDMLPLMISEERKYLVIIEELDKPPNKVLFKGFLDCKDMEQGYLKYQDVIFHASGYMSKLQYVYSPTVEVLENDSFINIILDCIDQAGTHPLGFTVKVNCSLVPIGASTGSNQTLFNKCGVYKEVFWKDNIERDSALDIIKKILTSFDCYMYWFDDDYYIERYADIWDTSPTYVNYISGNTYYPTDTTGTSASSKTIHDFVNLTKTDTSQVIGILVGQRQVELNIEQQRLFNFINNDYANAVEDNPVLPDPDRGEWLLWTNGTTLTWPEVSFGGTLLYGHGDPFRNITQSLYRGGYVADGGGPAGAAVWLGNFTKFRATVTDETVVTIKFKFGAGNNPFTLLDAGATGPEDYNIQFYWYLRNDDGANSYYIMYDEVAEVWERELKATQSLGIQVININGAELDPVLWTTEVALSIPLHEPYNSEWGGDQDFVLCLGIPIIERPTQSDIVMSGDYRGDVEVTMNSTLDENYISGEVNNNFLNKKTLTQYFSDISNLGIKNGILYGDATDSFDNRTAFWDDAQGSSGESLDLAEMKIKDKFRLYNVSRQKLTSSIQANEEVYQPLSLFEDGNQQDSTGTGPPEFVLVGWSYRVQSDIMDIILGEYDNKEQINLI